VCGAVVGGATIGATVVIDVSDGTEFGKVGFKAGTSGCRPSVVVVVTTTGTVVSVLPPRRCGTVVAASTRTRPRAAPDGNTLKAIATATPPAAIAAVIRNAERRRS
jgi:hypothetical protein